MTSSVIDNEKIKQIIATIINGGEFDGDGGYCIRNNFTSELCTLLNVIDDENMHDLDYAISDIVRDHEETFGLYGISGEPLRPYLNYKKFPIVLYGDTRLKIYGVLS